MKLTRINFGGKDIRMFRIGFGVFYGEWFIRVDLWNHGWRLTNANPK